MIDGGLRKLFHTNMPRFHWQAIETGLTGRGIPDSNYCYTGTEGWVEFKQTKGWAVTLAPEQVAWHLRRRRSGGMTYVAVRRHRHAGVRAPACDELWLFNGMHARELKAQGIVEPLATGVWYGGPGNWDWDSVAAILAPGPRPPAPA